MAKLFSGWLGRILLGLAVALSLSAYLFISGVADASLASLSNKDLLMKLLFWPALLGLATLGISSAYAFNTAQAAKIEAKNIARQEALQAEKTEQQAREQRARHTFSAQVVGLQWLNPLIRRDYSTEWNLLWTLGVAKPNKDDELVKEEPESFTKVQPVSGIAFNFPFSPADFNVFFEVYAKKLLLKFREPYFMYSTYFYTVHSKRERNWREVAGMHVQAALPTSLDPALCTQYIQQEVVSQFSIGKPNLSSSNTPPDVHVQQGGPAVGFRSLNAALDYLEQHPDKTAWVMSFDAPSFPKDSQMDESSTLLILAHPSYKTEREPLAWIHRVASLPANAYTSAPGKGSAQQQAWQATLQDAIDRADLQPQQIGYVIHDAGMGKSEQGSKRIGMLGQALTTSLPELDFTKQTFDTPALLGDLGAGTALTNLALAIAYAHHKNTPVLVAGTTEAETATAVVVRPPAKPRIFDPEKNWFRARGEGTAYLPWWGLRHDAPTNLRQGWSE